MIKMYRFLWLVILSLFLAGCGDSMDVDSADIDLDEIFSEGDGQDEEGQADAMKVIGVKFSPGYKEFTIQTGIIRDLGPYTLADTSLVEIKTIEKLSGVENDSDSKPILKHVINSEAEEVAKRQVKLLVLVDLALPQYVVDMERAAVKEMYAVFNHKNLFVAFMHGMNVSETIEVSDYVLDSYFTSKEDDYIYLYRSIQLKKREMVDRYGVWADAKKMGLIVFSDEKVYGDNDIPYDPEHFELQGALVNDTLLTDSLSISSVSFKKEKGGVDSDQAQSILKVISERSGGIYQNTFEWTAMKHNLVQSGENILLANEFVFENPDGKVYRGNPHTMRIEIYSKADSSLIGSATGSIYLGSPYSPVIVNGQGNWWMFVQGFALGGLLLLLVYLVFQFLIPYIRYYLFKKNYVIQYEPGLMSVGNVLVTESCYYCKAPFKTGDEIVAKCEHVMHKHCWDENGYHCPEHGRHCEDGSHYYNSKNPFDLQNASFYMKWILVAILTAICAWFAYMLYVIDYDTQTQLFVAKMMEEKFANIGERAVFNETYGSQQFVPVFGLILGFFLTASLSGMAVRKREFWKRLLDVMVRAVVVGIASYFVFWLIQTIEIAFDIEDLSILLDWIPWVLMALLIAVGSTMGTRILLKKYVLGIAIVLGVVSMYLWTFIFRGLDQVDIRVFLLISCVFFAVGLALAVAEMSPKSERYFLNVKGAVKEMDVALFKWFLNNPDEVVTIGKSIDCSLQMSWDIKGQVAPIHAEIRMVGSGIRLTAIEDGVMVGSSPLKPGHSIWLYHNTQFNIGDTTFTYIERDL